MLYFKSVISTEEYEGEGGGGLSPYTPKGIIEHETDMIITLTECIIIHNTVIMRNVKKKKCLKIQSRTKSLSYLDD